MVSLCFCCDVFLEFETGFTQKKIKTLKFTTLLSCIVSSPARKIPLIGMELLPIFYFLQWKINRYLVYIVSASNHSYTDMSGLYVPMVA